MKKIISLILSFSIICCVISVPASAASEKQNSQLTMSASDVVIGATGVLSIAGDYIYSNWFGNGEETWTTSIQDWAQITATISSAVAVFAPNPVAKSIAAKIHTASHAIMLSGFEIDHAYGTVYKSYREVTYSDGSFAFFQSKYIFTTVLVDADGTEESLPSMMEYYEGPYPMRLDT